jgi:hypothetical protein
MRVIDGDALGTLLAVPKTKQATAVMGVRVREGCEMGSKQEEVMGEGCECCAEVRRSKRNETRVRARCGTKWG